MKMVTVSQAKSQLSAYIKSAEQGEQVVIMRGSKPAVVLRPVTEQDMNLSPGFSLAALDSFEREILGDRKAGSLLKLGNDPAEAATTLNRRRSKRK